HAAVVMLFRCCLLLRYALALALVWHVRAGAAPEILSFEPRSGVAGTQVSILGQGLATATRVLFNGVEAQFSIDLSSGSIAAIVPQSAVTGRILVFTPDGFAASSEDFVIGDGGPQIVSFTAQGPIGADVVVILNRAVPISKLDFNGIEASFRLVSDTLI